MKTYTAGAEKLQAFLSMCFKAPPIFSIIGAVFLSKPQPNLNTTVLSCYGLNFDETLKVGSCEHLEQIPTVMVIFAQAPFVLATFVHIRNISALTYLILMKL